MATITVSTITVSTIITSVEDIIHIAHQPVPITAPLTLETQTAVTMAQEEEV
jgi:hypothetical protein